MRVGRKKVARLYFGGRGLLPANVEDSRAFEVEPPLDLLAILGFAQNGPCMFW